MRKILFLTFAVMLAWAGNIVAQTVNSAAGGGLEVVVKAAQTNLSLVTNLTVTGTIDARDFRFIRDSLRTTLTALDISGTTIAAYSGTGGSNYTPPPIMGAGGGADTQTEYLANEIPQKAFYKMWTTGNMISTVRHEETLTNLTTLVLPAGITKIGESAFQGASSLQALTIPASVTVLDSKALAGTGITSIDLNQVVTLGSPMFTGCSNLETVIIPNTVTSIGTTSGFFESCRKLKTVTFAEPCQITTLPFRMFYSNTSSPDTRLDSLKTVTVPSSVTDVTTAFESFLGNAIECHASNTVYYSEGGILYKKADNSLVYFPKGISSFTIPATMTVIPNNMFEGCVNLTSVTVLSQLTEIGNRAFYNCPISSFAFQNTLTKIGDYAFYNTNLTNVTLANNTNLATLGANIFSYNIHLKTIDLSGLTKLGTSMFTACDSLNSITFPPTITELPASVFSSCRSLTSIVIPNKVTSIGNSAFNSCISLTSVTLPDSLITLGSTVFQNDSLITSFHLGKKFATLTNSSGHAFASTTGAITVDPENPNYSAEDGMLFNKAKTKLFHVPSSRTDRNVVLPQTDSIMPYSFYNLRNKIHALTLPSNLKFIDNNGLNGAPKLDTLIVKNPVPAICGNVSYSLNNRYSENNRHPVVIIPARTKPAYIAAPGWSYYYNNANVTATPDPFVQVGGFYDLGLGYTNAVSPNGKYVVGDGSTSYIWNNGDAAVTPIEGAKGTSDVNDNGWVAGSFLDSNYIISGTPLTNGGVWRDGKWYSVGLGRYGTTTTSTEAYSSLNAIDAAGNVYGMSSQRSSVGRVLPFVWKYNADNDNYTTDTLGYATPANANDQGARFLDISSDGTVGSGWISRSIYGGSRMPIIWTSPTSYKVLDEETPGEAKGVSPNGKYIATTKDGKAALYDVEKDTILVFGVNNSSSVSVSDNGFVIGFANRTDNFNDGRQGFIWSERLGFTYLRDFIDKYAAEVQIPDDPFFKFPKNESVFDVPMSISADGLVIAGWSGYGAMSRKGWVLCIADTLKLIDRPHALNAKVAIADRNKVVLSWDEPTDYAPYTLDFYYIYRNGEYLGRVEEYEGATFTDANAPAGYVNYSVSAVYNYVNSTTYLESTKTEPITVSVVDSYAIPFVEDFESGSFSTNYWNAAASPTSGWVSFSYSGFSDSRSATFIAGGNGQAYSLSLTSKPLDATAKSKVILSFVYRVLNDGSEFLGRKDTIHVEVSQNDGTWTAVESLVINSTKPWTPVTLDLSSAGANKIFQVRFHAVSGDNRNYFNLDIDNVGVSTESSDIAPTGVYAYRFENKTDVHVVYKDITGSYGASHTVGKVTQHVGNDGVPFTIAQRFDSNDLVAYKDKYLTSVNAYIFADRANTTPTSLKLAVFVNGFRVEDSSIASFTGNAWNTFKLNTPIQITGSDEILVGIEVAAHDAANWPVGLDDADVDNTNVKGNLLSYDNGTTWISANQDEQQPMDGNWAIVANIRDEATAETIDNDAAAIAYNIYRNDALIATLHYWQNFVDADATEDACYKVEAFRALGGLSPKSEQGCVNVILLGIKDVSVESLTVYPNPAKTVVNISQPIENVKIYNMKGSLVLQSTTSKIDISSLSKGIYIFDAKLANGNKATARVIME